MDVCIGEQEDGFFRPVVYLLTKDGVVEYVDVLRCLLFGDAMICQDPIYFANNGVALELCGSEVDLRRKDGSVLELAPLSAEWSAQEIPYSVTGSYNYTSETGWNWLDLGSDGSVQLGVQDNSRIYRATPRIWVWCPRAWCWTSLPTRPKPGRRPSSLWRRSRPTCTTRT